MYSPWVLFAKKVQELFGKDEGVRVEFTNEPLKLKLYVEGDNKADAIAKLLPSEVNFGNVVMPIEVVPSNRDDSRMGLLKRAFEGNPIIKDFQTKEVIGNTLDFLIFRKEVVQYKNDDISEADGVCSTLYQDIAKEILGESEGVYFCTSISAY